MAKSWKAVKPMPRKRCCATAARACRHSSTGCCPPSAAELTSYTVYRWECAIRSSVVLGFVGAGGLGQQLDNSMKMFNGGEVASMLLVFIALVALADRVSAWLRKALG
jgi:phosphonate transport system permease protein